MMRPEPWRSVLNRMADMLVRIPVRDALPPATVPANSSNHLALSSEEPTSRQVSEVPTEDREEGEEMDMDATNDDDAAMMAMMGLSGFGSTKVETSRTVYGSVLKGSVGKTC